MTAFTRPDAYLPGFELHASPEAIQAHINKTRARADALQNELGWLEGLYLRRVAEKSAGRWPVSEDAAALSLKEALATDPDNPWLAALLSEPDEPRTAAILDIEAREIRKGDDLFGAGVVTVVYAGSSVRVEYGGTGKTFRADEIVTVRRV